MRIKRSFVIVGLVLATCAGDAAAQNVYQPRPTPYPYPAPYGGGFYPGRVGGALYGQADVLRASGEVMIQQEQARIEREKANQEKLVTKKKSFEQMMWEKANTATLTENLKYESQLSLARMMSSPTPAEITNGATLNAMLPLLKSLTLQGIHGPAYPLDPSQVRQINVSIGKSGANVGMLTQPKQTWPLILADSKYKAKTEALLQQATSQAAMGALDLKTYRELNSSVSACTEELRKKFHKDEINGGEFLEGKRFLDKLQQNVTALRDPASQRMLDGTYAAKGHNVPELVDYMTKQGLSFAPGNPGSEAAYIAIHDTMVAYTHAAQASGGISVQYMPPRTAAFANK